MGVSAKKRDVNVNSATTYAAAPAIDDVIDVLAANDSLKPALSGRRARRRAKENKLSKSGILLPLFAAQGCLSVGKDDDLLNLSGAGGMASEPFANGDSFQELGLHIDFADDRRDGVGASGAVLAGNDQFAVAGDTALALDPADLLANDFADNGQGLEIVRVFNAQHGSVMFDGAIIEFVPDDGFDGRAQFQYEVRDASGNTTTALVEVSVGQHAGPPGHGGAGHGGGHADDDDHSGMGGGHGGSGTNGAGGHGSGHGGSGTNGAGGHGGGHGGGTAHAHPTDPSKMAEHMALLNLVPVADASHVAINNGSWFDPNTWANGEVPGDGADVVVPHGVVVHYDSVSDVSLHTVRVDGDVHFATDKNTFMEVDTFIVTPSGHLTIGTIDNPVADNVEAVIQIADNGPIDVAWDPMLLSRGLISHGSIEVHGSEKDSFLRLAEDPMRGDTSMVLDTVPSGWEVGDRLVLTGTEMGDRTRGPAGQQRDISTQDEELVITRIDGNVVHFDRALQYDHDTPRADLKAYVANYSRNVRILTENADALPPSQRGHVMLMHSDDIDVRYAEFSDLGRTDKSERAFDVDDLAVVESDSNLKGRYSLHIHRAGVSDQDDPAMVVGNAVWGSPGWGYVHHDSNAIFADNAAYDVFGAAFVAESGNETGRWVRNISIKNEGVGGVDWDLNTPKSGADVNAFDLGRNGTGFWFQGRLVDAVDNVAAGSPGGHGFTYFHRGSDGNQVQVGTLNTPEISGYQDDTLNVNFPHISQFQNNEAIAVGVGFMVVKSDEEQRHDLRSVLEDLTAWNVRTGIHLEYTAHYTIINPDLIAVDATGNDNQFGIDLRRDVHDLVVVGGNIDGFHWGVNVNNEIDPSVGSDMFFIDVNITNLLSDHRGPGVAYTGLDPSMQVLTGAQAAALPGVGALSFVSDFADFDPLGSDTRGKQNLTGDKYDSLGEYEIGRLDPHLVSYRGMQRAVAEEGYWTLPDGRAVTAIERYFADRATGETIKISTFVEIPGGVDEAQRYGGEFHGLLDQAGAGPNAVNDVARVASGGRIDIDVLANDSDPEGDRIAVDGLGEARNGSVWANDDGTITYQPDPNFSGSDSFYYWVEDDNGNFAKAWVQVTVDV